MQSLSLYAIFKTIRFYVNNIVTTRTVDHHDIDKMIENDIDRTGLVDTLNEHLSVRLHEQLLVYNRAIPETIDDDVRPDMLRRDEPKHPKISYSEYTIHTTYALNSVDKAPGLLGNLLSKVKRFAQVFNFQRLLKPVKLMKRLFKHYIPIRERSFPKKTVVLDYMKIPDVHTDSVVVVVNDNLLVQLLSTWEPNQDAALRSAQIHRFFKNNPLVNVDASYPTASQDTHIVAQIIMSSYDESHSSASEVFIRGQQGAGVRLITREAKN
jgi:hypothetical protein